MNVHDHVRRVSDRVDAIDALLDSALHANVAQVGMRQNEDMRRITAWVAIIAVPTMFAGIYGMNFDHMPELRWRFGYPLVLLGDRHLMLRPLPQLQTAGLVVIA